uniref:protein LMBR1L-like isoform X1 n=1 Tax=Styela clava TaxID=7725 RepID=UPI0019399CE5|nr:protein LMBR1L-like isoform X1 [Styela clava]
MLIDWISSAFNSPEENISIEEKEEEFNNVVRENIIGLLTFIVLYIAAYCIIVFLHRKKERDEWYGGEDEAKVYRISLYLCAATLAVSISAILMLPMSMIGNEIVHLFPGSYWVQWLNGALIHSLWDWTYALSNLSVFVLLPFSYFFTESEGFTGQRKGLLPRVYETVTVLLLLAVLVFGLAVLALAFFDKDNSGLQLLTIVGEYYLQYLFSFLLCAFVIIMLTCSPFGFILLFDMVGKLLVKPKILENNEEQINAAKYEEDTLKRKLRSHASTLRCRQDRESLKRQMEEVRTTRMELERRQKASAWERNLGYPLTMLLLIILTGLALFLVVIHILELVFIGDNELQPKNEKGAFHKDYRSYSADNQKFHQQEKSKPWGLFSSVLKDEQNNHMATLGATSLSAFGIVGTMLEVAVIFYLMLASVVGLYNLPGFKKMRPQRQDTSMTGIIFNCLTIQLLGSSLPVLCRILGITEFVLQGSYGQFSWLGNFYVVFFCNLAFAGFTAFCLTKKVTTKMRNELYKALGDQTKFLYASTRAALIFPLRKARDKNFLQFIDFIHSCYFVDGLDKRQSWTSRWSTSSAVEISSSPAHSPPPSPRISSSRNRENMKENGAVVINESRGNNKDSAATTSGIILEKLEEIDKLTTALANHDEHLHNTAVPKENGIAGR